MLATNNYVHTAGISRDGDDWLLADAVGSVRATVDDTGVTTGSQDFTVFGEQLAGTGSFGFAGEQQDLTGQLHLRARQYNPTLGRFTTVDPVQPGAPGTTGYNLYTYSGNNPTTFTDPSGRAVLAERALLGGAAVVIVASAFAATNPAQLCLNSVAGCPAPTFGVPDIDFQIPDVSISLPGLPTPVPAVSPTSVVLGTVAGAIVSTVTSTTITTTTTTSTTSSSVRLPVLFGQRRIGPTNFFGNITEPGEAFFDASILRVFATPVFPGVLIAINNRTLATLSLAGRTSPIAACITAPTVDEFNRLFERPLFPPAVTLPSRTIPVTAARSDATPTPAAPFAVTSTVSVDVRSLLPCTPDQLVNR